MATFDVFLGYVNFKKNGLIANQSGDNAMDIYERYRDEDERRKAGIRSCWVVEAGKSLAIRGVAPAGFSRNDPVYQNG
jgi:hypothetical protein